MSGDLLFAGRRYRKVGGTWMMHPTTLPGFIAVAEESTSVMLDEIDRLRAVLATIDNAHEPQVDTDLDSLTMGGLFCTEDDEPWPCRTHLLLHPGEARRG